MIRPPRKRRARARRDARVGSDDPGLTSNPPPLPFQVRCRAQERQGRAQRPGASRVVALSLRYLATRGVTKENEMPAPRRMSRAFESRARASRRARGGPSTRDTGARARRVSGAFRRAFPLTRATAGWFERAIQARRRRATRTSGANAVFESRTRLVGALCHCSPCFCVFVFLFLLSKTTIDRSNDRSMDERALDLVAHPHDLPRSPRPHHVTPKDPRCGRCSLHRQGG